MTEESLFAVNRSDLESRVIVDALDNYRTAGSAVRLDAVTEATGADMAVVRERFPTDEDLASACLRWLAGEWTGFDVFARQFRNAASGGVVILLDWVSGVRREYPALLDAAGFAAGDPAFDEVVAFVSVVLGQTTAGRSAVPSPADVKRARACVGEAARGGDWRVLARLPGRRSTPAR